jgi:hypothetical protein
MENNQAGVFKLTFGRKEFNITQKIHVYHICVYKSCRKLPVNVLLTYVQVMCSGS